MTNIEKEMIAKRPAGDKINPNKRAIERIDSKLNPLLKERMKEYTLSEEEHEEILEDIKRTSYEGKTKVANPKFLIVLGQTGSGNSNLTASIYSKDDNLVIIDSEWPVLYVLICSIASSTESTVLTDII